ncbi:MAG: transglutaminase domain-containing protein [Bacteroidota bacterium]|nr:transglutaminase domain-containing protein [Bacteroidota bacterium]
MRFLIISLWFVFYTPFIIAQDKNDYRSIDQYALDIPKEQANTTLGIADYLNQHFDTDSKKVRAAYVWVIANIKYDKDSIYRVILDEDRDEQISYSLKRRKGICENFAAIFSDICNKSGMKSFVVEGYTKEGGTIDKAGHAWSAVLVNNNWLLFDPAWDEGGIKGSMFAIPIKTNYFEVSPLDFIKTHLPIDPLFQFLSDPFSFKEFLKGHKIINNNAPYFNYADSIIAYEKSDTLTRYANTLSRIESYGWPAHMVTTKLKQIKFEIEVLYEDRDMFYYNSAVADYNSAIDTYNNFLRYRNNQFQPEKKQDDVIGMFNYIRRNVAAAMIKLDEVSHSKATLVLDTGDIQKKIDDLAANVKLQEAFFKNYMVSSREN